MKTIKIITEPLLGKPILDSIDQGMLISREHNCDVEFKTNDKIITINYHNIIEKIFDEQYFNDLPKIKHQKK